MNDNSEPAVTNNSSTYRSFKSMRTLQQRKDYLEERRNKFDPKYIFIVLEPHKRSKKRL
jgi:hypothetical protein